MLLYNQTNIKDNIIYFPLWRVKYLKHVPWSWEHRYMNLISLNLQHFWSHNCLKMGAINVPNNLNYCGYCGASKLNEPSDEAILEYMDSFYEQ